MFEAPMGLSHSGPCTAAEYGSLITFLFHTADGYDDSAKLVAGIFCMGALFKTFGLNMLVVLGFPMLWHITSCTRCGADAIIIDLDAHAFAE